MNAELIKTLRWCGSEDERHEMCVDESYRCPMWNEDRITDECKAELMRAAADALEKSIPREWWLKMRAHITDLAENNKDVPRNKPYYDYAVFLLRLMDTIEADSKPASKLVVPKFKQITADSLADMCEGVELDEDGFPMVDILEHVEEDDNGSV